MYGRMNVRTNFIKTVRHGLDQESLLFLGLEGINSRSRESIPDCTYHQIIEVQSRLELDKLNDNNSIMEIMRLS